MRTAVKPYPSCRYGHAGIDAALALRAELALQPGEIEHVTLGLPTSGMLLVGAPAEKKVNPENVVDGQFSGPFVIATALVTGKMGWGQLRPPHRPGRPRPPPPHRLRERQRRPGRNTPPTCPPSSPCKPAAQTYTRMVKIPKGEPANFLTDAELRAKFHDLATPVLGNDQTARLADALLAIDSAPQPRPPSPASSPPPSAPASPATNSLSRPRRANPPQPA